MGGERVDEAVERLEGDALALVAAALEHQRLALAAELVEEPARERALAHPAPAVHVHRDRSARPRRAVRVEERLELAVATEERGGGRRGGARAHRSGRARRAEAPEDLGARGPSLGLDAPELEAELVEIGGDAGRGGRGRLRLVQELGAEDVGDRALRGEAAGERLVEHHADRVPVARRRRRLAADLLGRHVRGRAAGAVVALTRVAPVGGEAEVEDDDAAVARDHDVARLEIAVQLARGVERREPRRELGQRLAEARDPVGVERLAARARRGDRLEAHRHVAVQHRGLFGDRARGAAQGGERELAADVMEEPRAVDELHGEEAVVSYGDELVERHQVGVDDVGDGPELRLEAEQARGVHPLQGLERHDLPSLEVARAVDDAHPARAEQREHLEATQLHRRIDRAGEQAPDAARPRRRVRCRRGSAVVLGILGWLGAHATGAATSVSPGGVALRTSRISDSHVAGIFQLRPGERGLT